MRGSVGHGLVVLITFMVPGIVVANPDNTDREIQHLMAYIAGAECRFVRNGKEYGPEEARKHIGRKYEYARSRVETAEDFIRNVASKSSMSGKPYRVRCKDQTMLCADWLEAELKRFRQKSRKRGP